MKLSQTLRGLKSALSPVGTVLDAQVNGSHVTVHFEVYDRDHSESLWVETMVRLLSIRMLGGNTTVHVTQRYFLKDEELHYRWMIVILSKNEESLPKSVQLCVEEINSGLTTHMRRTELESISLPHMHSGNYRGIKGVYATEDEARTARISKGGRA